MTSTNLSTACPSCGGLPGPGAVVCPECGLALRAYSVAPWSSLPEPPADGAETEPVPISTVIGDLDERYRILRPIADGAAVHSRQVYVAQGLKCRNCYSLHGENDSVCETCGLGIDEEITLLCQIDARQAAVARALMQDLSERWPERLIRCRSVFEQDGNQFAVLSDGMSPLSGWQGSAPGDIYEEAARALRALSEVDRHGYRVPQLDLAFGVSAQQLVLTPLALAKLPDAVDEISGLPSIEHTAIELLDRLQATTAVQAHAEVVKTLNGISLLMRETSADYLETGVRALLEATDKARRAPALRLLSGRVSSEGVLRRGSANEDSACVMEFSRVWIAEPHSLGFYGVADGMGGHDAGEVASRLALEALASWVLRRIVEPWLVSGPLTHEEIGRQLVEGVEQAHRQVRDGGEDASKDMGTTLTAAVIVDTQVFVVNVGDSRTYLWRGQERLLRQVSHDHSVVQELVDRGELAPEDVYTDPRRNVILASLGAPSEGSGVDLFVETMGPSDRLLLCSDGLWEMVFDQHLAAVIDRNPDPQACAEELVNLACAHGGVDNVTAMVVQLQERPSL